MYLFKYSKCLNICTSLGKKLAYLGSDTWQKLETADNWAERLCRQSVKIICRSGLKIMFILSENFILGENCYIGLQRSKGIQKKVIVLFLTIITGGLYQNPFSFYLSCSTASWICEDLCCSGLNCLKLLVF